LPTLTNILPQTQQFMKTSTWIKFIGILCIVFGAIGIMENIFSLLFLMEETVKAEGQMAEVSPDLLRLVTKFPYINLLVLTIYLMAGIFFLMKKPFSIIFMYISLTLSILWRIIPMLFLHKYNSTPFSDYSFNIFHFIGPVIDLVLLLGVCRISRHYFKSSEELSELFRENKKTLSKQFFKILIIAGLFCFSIPLSIFLLWGHAFNLGKDQAERVAIFNSFFPHFLRGRFDITYLSIVFCILTIILVSINMTISARIWKIINIIVLVFSILMLLMNLFSLM
jgi:hypothetical protein